MCHIPVESSRCMQQAACCTCRWPEWHSELQTKAPSETETMAKGVASLALTTITGGGAAARAGAAAGEE